MFSSLNVNKHTKTCEMKNKLHVQMTASLLACFYYCTLLVIIHQLYYFKVL
jgi:hypothetical protein